MYTTFLVIIGASLLLFFFLNWLYNIHHYTVEVRQMAITSGSSGVFQAVLNDNGAPIALPAGAVWTFTTDNPLATINPSGADQAVISIPAENTATTIIVTATTTDPTGASVNGTLSVDITPGEQHVFTVTVSQLS